MLSLFTAFWNIFVDIQINEYISKQKPKTEEINNIKIREINR